MDDLTTPEARLLSAAERDMVSRTRHPELRGAPRDELRAILARLREHRDRATEIARRQRREMRGKAAPHGATASRDDMGTVAKAQLLGLALRRVSQELRRRDQQDVAPDQAALSKAALEAKRAGASPRHPGPGRTASAGMGAKPSGAPKVKVDPREIGRVSKAGKVAQARRGG